MLCTKETCIISCYEKILLIKLVLLWNKNENCHFFRGNMFKMSMELVKSSTKIMRHARHLQASNAFKNFMVVKDFYILLSGARGNL